FRSCMKRARICGNFDELLAAARDINACYGPPMDDGEVMTIAKNVWSYTERGQNRFGQHGAWFPIEEVATLLHDQDAFVLLAFLRTHNGPLSQFMIANSLSEEKLGWGRKRLAAARQRLIELGHIKQIRPASQRKPALYQWT